MSFKDKPPVLPWEKTEPAPDERKCRKCKQFLHRSQFVPRDAVITVRYDVWCHHCRNLRRKYMPPDMLFNRLRDGLMTQKQFDREREKAAEALHKNALNWGHAGRVNRKRVTWDKPHRSVNAALELLRKYPFPEHCQAWSYEVMAMVLAARKEIKKRKSQEKLPTDRLLFWYDVIYGAANELRAKVAAYPDGPDKCPIQVM